jgi:type IV pilus assembly protein PilB
MEDGPDKTFHSSGDSSLGSGRSYFTGAQPPETAAPAPVPVGEEHHLGPDDQEPSDQAATPAEAAGEKPPVIDERAETNAPATPESPPELMPESTPESPPAHPANPPAHEARPREGLGRDAPPKLGEVLVAAGVLSQVQLLEALQTQRRDARHRRLGEILLYSGIVTEGQLTRALSGQLRVSYADLPTLAISHEVVSLIPRELAERHQVIPIGLSDQGYVILAMADPTDIVARDDVRVVTGRPVKAACARPSHVRQAIDRYYRFVGAPAVIDYESGSRRPNAEFVHWVTSAVEPEADKAEHPGTGASSPSAPSAIRPDEPRNPLLVPPEPGQENANPVDLVAVIFEDAMRAGASDIHVEPRPQGVDVRFRVDGLLQEVLTIPKHLQVPLVTRVKVLASLDLEEHRRPQEGRVVLQLRDNAVDARVSTVPTLHGEKIVIRLLDAAQEVLELENLGFNDADRAVVERVVKRPQGMIIVAGPAGSGKKSTLHALLHAVQRPNINIVSIEDPIEYQLSGVNQVEVDERSGMTFAKALRSVLRQDPDVVMLGEIRDADTAEIACQAALSGQLVLSTIQTVDAPGAITRLVDMGVAPSLIASSLLLVIAQRLVRRVCPECVQLAEVSPRVLDALGILPADGTLVRGEGCLHCHYTGYQGRVGVYQLLEVSDIVREQIITQVSERTIAHIAETAGSQSLERAGVDLALSGITTAEEVVRVVHPGERPRLTCPGCGAEAQPEFVVCPFCHTEITTNACRSCGKELMAGWMACPFCTAPVVSDDQARGQAEEGDGAGPYRLLVVEDDDDVRRVIEVMLTAEGYTVMTAGDGEEALRIAARHRPHVILLDIMLPDQSGIEVCRSLRNLSQTSLVPVIFLTARTDMQTELASFAAGGDDYLVKPVDRERLLARIASRLRTGALT